MLRTIPGRLLIISIILLILTVTAWLAVNVSQTAGAGIGPNGFARYARQGIVNENNHVYGNGNSPWNVTCTDTPNYSAVSDRVVCVVTLKKLP